MAEPTRYTESNALLAVQVGDMSHARELLVRMLPGELEVLARAAEGLAELCRELGPEVLAMEMSPRRRMLYP